MKKFIGFLKDEKGATAIEYGLIASLISIVIVVALRSIGLTLTDTFQMIIDGFGLSYRSWFCSSTFIENL